MRKLPPQLYDYHTRGIHSGGYLIDSKSGRALRTIQDFRVTKCILITAFRDKEGESGESL